jgi:hypothetical protein
MVATKTKFVNHKKKTFGKLQVKFQIKQIKP